MSQDPAALRTPLYDAHVTAGGKMVDFAGWEMPVQYQGIAVEHQAVREGAGVFDVSHMGELIIEGEQATEFLSFISLNNPAKLKAGRGQYSMLPNNEGGLIDDIYLYREADTRFLMVCNAANRTAVLAHVHERAAHYAVTIRDISEDYALMALQGPKAEDILASLLSDEAEALLRKLKKNRFLDTTVIIEGQAIAIRPARTGYTGEDGFEIFVAPDEASLVWEALLEAGVTPCGLGARDTLRLEAGFPLFGHEFDATTNPRCSYYAWVVKDKDFYGRENLWNKDCGQRLVALETRERGIPREGYEVLVQDNVVGRITSGTQAPLSKKGIALAWLDTAHSALGTAVHIQVRNRKVAAEVVEVPFYSK